MIEGRLNNVQSNTMAKYRVTVDTGGTFSDVFSTKIEARSEARWSRGRLLNMNLAFLPCSIELPVYSADSPRRACINSNLFELW